MKSCKKEISKEIYDRAVANGGIIAGEDYQKVFTPQEYLGYGVYSQRVIEQDGKHYAQYEIGDTCD